MIFVSNIMVWLVFTSSLLMLLIIIGVLLFMYFGDDNQISSEPQARPKTVSIIMAVHNEATRVKDKVDFFLSENEWLPGSELIIISDGSTDATNQQLATYENDPRIKIIYCTKKMQKAQALNKAVATSTKDILVFSDCRQQLKGTAVNNIIKYFCDPTVGAVNGTIVDGRNNPGGSLLRRINTLACAGKSGSSSALNLNGAFYAQRRAAFRPFPENTINDDLFALVSTLSQGYTVKQALDVEVYDMAYTDYYENRRIVRIVKGNLVFLSTHWTMLSKIKFSTLVNLFVFKFIKLLSPVFAVLFFLSGTYLLGAWFAMAGVSLLAVLASSQGKEALRFFSFLVRATVLLPLILFSFIVLRQRKIAW